MLFKGWNVLMLCMGCGALLNESQIKNGNGKCPFCGSDNLNDEIYEYNFAFKDYFQIYDISHDAQFILQMIKLKNENPIEYQLKLKQFEDIKNEPKCPKCGSTNITAGQRGYSLLTGFLGSNKTVNRCTNCGHTWKP